MTQHLAKNAKAYVALLLAVVTALAGIFTTGQVGVVLTAAVAVLTAVTVWLTPNADPAVVVADTEAAVNATAAVSPQVAVAADAIEHAAAKVTEAVDANPVIADYTVSQLKSELAKRGVTVGLSKKRKTELERLLHDAITKEA